MTSQRPLTLALAALVLAGLPYTTSNAYYLDIVVQIYMWATAAVAWNVLGGYAGQFSLGHAAFFGIGAYTSSLLLLATGLTPWIGMLAGGALSALFALVIGYLAIRLRGPFFTLATIALAEVLQILAVYFRELTGGSQGLSLPFAASVAAFTFEGKAMRAVAQDPVAALALAIDTDRVYMETFVAGICCVGLAGVLLAPSYPIFPAIGVTFGLVSYVVVVLGGLGSMTGAVLGGFVVGVIEVFSGYFLSTELKQAFDFLIFVLVLLVRPQGLFGQRGAETMGFGRIV